MGQPPHVRLARRRPDGDRGVAARRTGARHRVHLPEHRREGADGAPRRRRAIVSDENRRGRTGGIESRWKAGEAFRPVFTRAGTGRESRRGPPCLTSSRGSPRPRRGRGVRGPPRSGGRGGPRPHCSRAPVPAMGPSSRLPLLDLRDLPRPGRSAEDRRQGRSSPESRRHRARGARLVREARVRARPCREIDARAAGPEAPERDRALPPGSAPHPTGAAVARGPRGRPRELNEGSGAGRRL